MSISFLAIAVWFNIMKAKAAIEKMKKIVLIPLNKFLSGPMKKIVIKYIRQNLKI